MALLVASLLALGVGIAGATFAVFHALTWAESEIHDTERLEVLWRHDPRGAVPFYEISLLDYLDLRAASETLEDLAAFGAATHYGVMQLNEPVPVDVSDVSVSFFDVLGARPALGRTFLPDEELPSADRAMVLSHGLWRRVFASDPDIIGRRIQLERNDSGVFTVIGVMPEEFGFPFGVELWVAMQRDQPLTKDRFLAYLFMVGRLKPNVERSEAQAELTALLATLDATHAPDRGRQDTMALTPFLDYHLGDGTRPALRAMIVAVLLVLVVTWVNAGSLLVVRAGEREHDRKIRRAVGASRLDIAIGAISEAAVVFALSVPAAIVTATIALAALRRLGPADIPGLTNARLGVAAVAVILALAFVSLVLLGVATSLRAFRDGTLGKTVSHARGLVLGSEVAIAVIVLAASGLTLQSLVRLNQADLGYDVERLLTFEIVASDEHYPDLSDKKAFHRLALERIRGVPGVAAASGVLLRPFGAGSVGWDMTFVVEGQAFDWQEIEYEGQTYRLPDFAADKENPTCNMEEVTPGYFETMGIELIEGRDFTDSDDDDSPHVLIVSEGLAELVWPGESAIGKGLYAPDSRFDDDLVRVPSRVVGVVENAHYREIDDVRFDIYQAYAQSDFPLRNFVVRTRGSVESVVPAIRRELREIAPLVPMGRIASLDDVIREERAPWRFNAILFAVFAVVSGLMTALGIFAAVAQSVVERQREIGLRMAIGANAAHVVWLSIHRAMKPVLIGIGLGTAAALLLSRYVASLLYGIPATDPATYTVSAIVFAVVALVASYIPARRAALVDPMVTLRHD